MCGIRRGQLTNVSILLSILPDLLPLPHTTLPLLRTFIDSTLLPLISPAAHLLPPDTPALHARALGAHNSLLRKLAVKVRGRWWTAWLGVCGFRKRGKRASEVGVGRGEGGAGMVGFGARDEDVDMEDDEVDVPEGVEGEIDALLAALGDKVKRGSRPGRGVDVASHR